MLLFAEKNQKMLFLDMIFIILGYKWKKAMLGYTLQSDTWRGIKDFLFGICHEDSQQERQNLTNSCIFLIYLQTQLCI